MQDAARDLFAGVERTGEGHSSREAENAFVVDISELQFSLFATPSRVAPFQGPLLTAMDRAGLAAEQQIEHCYRDLQRFDDAEDALVRRLGEEMQSAASRIRIAQYKTD